MESTTVTVDGGKGQPDFYQNVVAMRHGDRLDNFDPNWVNTAARPWDPPLIDDGKARAFRTGRTLRNSAGFPIHRVFVSPFIRCVQTATQAIYALTAVEDDPTAVRGDDLPIDQSKLKANVELGLCEMLNTIAIKPNLVPRDGKWGFNVSELEAILPAGTVDPTVERVYNELPKWEESVLETRTRYQQIYKALADKYPTENLLLVTHGEAVGVAVSTYLETTVYGVEYCAYAKLRRPIYRVGDSFKAGNFEVVTDDGLPGIKYASIGENE